MIGTEGEIEIETGIVTETVIGTGTEGGGMMIGDGTDTITGTEAEILAEKIEAPAQWTPI